MSPIQNDSVLTVEIRSWDEQLLRSVYEQLESHGSGGWFLTRSWIQAWLATIDNGAEKRLILLFREGERQACGMLPLFRASRWSPWRILGDDPITCPDHLDLVIEKGLARAGWHAVLETLSKSKEFAWLDLDHLDRESALPAVAQEFKFASGLFSAEVLDSRPCYRIDLRGGWHAVLRGLSSKMRSNIKRTEQRMVAELDTCFEELKSVDERLKGLDELVALHSIRWSERGEGGAFAQTGLKSLLRNIICSSGETTDKVRIFRLSASQKPVGVLLGFSHDNSFLFYTTGFDASLARFSPGTVLISRALQCVSVAGLHTFDFLRGGEFYKSQWSKDLSTDVGVKLYFGWAGCIFREASRMIDVARGLRSHLGRALKHAKRWVSRSVDT